LKRSLKYWHWADVSLYTHPYGLAESCVFVKQSDLPSHCALQRQPKGNRRRDPLCRRHGASLPNSLDWIIPFTPEVSHLGAPVLVLGTNTKDLFQSHFHGLQASAECTKRCTIPKFNLVLIITILPRFVLVSNVESIVSLAQSVSDWTCVAAHTLAVREY
jgi:hypothetical protein